METKKNIKNCGRGCDQHWDVRCCCELDCKAKNTNKQFRACPMKLPTIYFTLGNDSGLYEAVENNEWGVIKKHFKLNKDEIQSLKEMYVTTDEDDIERGEDGFRWSPTKADAMGIMFQLNANRADRANNQNV